MPTISYDEGKQHINAPDCSVERLETLIRALNNGSRTFVAIAGADSYITVSGGNQNRVMLSYQEIGRAGMLLDPKIPHDAGEIEMVIETDHDIEPLRRTVNRDDAIKVATYYLEHETVPEGLVWDGNMSRFE